MSKPGTIPHVSFKHAREGTIGVDGQLPPGWSGELASLTEIIRVDGTGAGPALTMYFEFGPSEASEFVSIVAGSFVHGAPSDLYLLRADIELTNVENVSAGFAIIREWEQNGPCVGQQARPFSLTAQPSRALVAFQIRDSKHLLQPVFSFKRDPAKSGGGLLTVRKMIFVNMYEYSDLFAG